MDGPFYDAVVADTGDPASKGRVRLQIPQLSGTAVTGWAEPLRTGAVKLGDQVFASFKGGDLNSPVFMPLLGPDPAPWTPITLNSGWSPRASQGPPECRISDDRMLELHGAIQINTAPAPGANLPFATLPDGFRPLYNSLALCSSDYSTAYATQAVLGANDDGGYQSTTTYSTTLTGASGTAPAVNFIAPGSGTVIVTLMSWAWNTVAADSCFMSARITQGATTILAESDDRAAVSVGDKGKSVSTAFSVTDLTPGVTYTATAYYRSSTAGSNANFDSRRLLVEPVQPFSLPLTRVLAAPDGTLSALFPHGTASFAVSLVGFRTRAA